MANYPVINIGLGTTGGEIVSTIAQTIRREGEKWCKDYVENIVFLSESEPPREIDTSLIHNIVTLCPGATPTKTYVDGFFDAEEGISDQFKTWYPLDATGKPEYPPSTTFEEGCAGFRPAGRLLLHRMLAGNTSVRTTLRTLFQRIQETAARQIRNNDIRPEEVDPQNFICNVFGTLAGGTASGLLLDFSLLLRSAVTDAGVNAWLFGYFLTGDTCYMPTLPIHRSAAKVEMQTRNTNRALCELAVTQSMAGWQEAAGKWPRKIGSDDLSDSPSLAQGNIFPFNIAFLIGGSRMGQRSPALANTKEYFQLVANAVGQRLTSKIDIERMGSLTDILNTHRNSWAKEQPKRAAEIGSIGYLHIRLPKKKILAVALNRMAEKVLAEQMKKHDPQLASEVFTEIRNLLGLDNLVMTWFLAPEEDFSAKTGEDPVADDGGAFKDAWESAVKNMVSHYSKWKESDDGAKACAEQFAEHAEKATRQLIDRCLSPNTFSFGTLKVLLEDLTNEIREQINISNKRLAEVNALLLEGEGAEKRFIGEVSALSKQYPKKGFLGMFDARQSWHGHKTAHEFFTSIRDAVRVRAQLLVAIEALNAWRGELDRLSVIRKLVGKQAAYVILQQAKSREAVEFGQQVATGCQHEIVSTRAEVMRFSEQQLFRDGELLKKGQAAFVQAFCRALAETNASNGERLSNLDSVREKFREASANVAADHNSAWEDLKIKEIVMSVRSHLRSAFVEQEKQVEERVNQMTIWDAITAAIDNQGEEAINELLTLFGRFKSMGKVFWNPSDLQQDKRMEESRICVFCDKEVAEKHLASLDIHEENFLQRLMREAFGGIPEIQDKKGYSEIVSFIEMWGLEIRNPEFPQVAKVLDGGAAGPTEYWSDSRFPEWIKALK